MRWIGECEEEQLPAWEQAYLKETVFGQSPQVSFTQAGFGANNGEAQLYGSYSLLAHSKSSKDSSGNGADTPPSTASAESKSTSAAENRFVRYGPVTSPSSHSIGFGVAGPC